MVETLINDEYIPDLKKAFKKRWKKAEYELRHVTNPLELVEFIENYNKNNKSLENMPADHYSRVNLPRNITEKDLRVCKTLRFYNEFYKNDL